jgi:hypothetical protein
VIFNVTLGAPYTDSIKLVHNRDAVSVWMSVYSRGSLSVGRLHGDAVGPLRGASCLHEGFFERNLDAKIKYTCEAEFVTSRPKRLMRYDMF